MKLLAPAALLIAVASCQSSGGGGVTGPANAEAIFKAPMATTGSGLDPETQGPVFDTAATGTGATASKPAGPSPFQTKEITVDPKDAKSKVDLARTLLGEEWMFKSKTVKSGGIVVWKFVRRDVARLDVDPFGIPDIHKPGQDPFKKAEK